MSITPLTPTVKRVYTGAIMRLCILTALLTTAALGQQPRIVRLLNNYSYIFPGMPNYGIAQGSIFDIFGSNLATATSPLQSVPLPRTLSGTSVKITVNGVTTQAILYYVAANQIAAILPSATPTGTGQITVTVNGQTSPPAPITVVQTAFGMLSLNGVGNGPAGVYDVNSQFLTWTNAANPGDFITLWGSGLGPVTGDETIAQTPVDLTNIPIEIDIGGEPAVVQYHGRSVYPGLDQINVQVPAGVSGCHVSVVVRSGDIVSNFGTIPVAANGRVCSEPVIGLTDSQVQTLMSYSGVNRGVLDFSGNSADATFVRFTAAQFAVRQPGGIPSFGNCTVFNFNGPNQVAPNPIRPTALDAGPSIRLSTPSDSGIGDVSIPGDNGNYSAMLQPTGSLKGTYTFSGSGGADIGPFSAQVNWPGGGGKFTFSTNGSATTATRSQGLTVTWSSLSNTDSNEFVQIAGSSMNAQATPPVGAAFACNVPLSPGRFTVPSAVLLALPPQASAVNQDISIASLEVDIVISHSFAAPAVDFGTINFIFQNLEPFSYQ